MSVPASRLPLATYRWQFHAGFTFADAEARLGYLHELGISDVYASPLFRAGPGSSHGYDVCAYEVNPALGGPAAFDQFCCRTRERGLGLLLDIVPNHMRADSSNPWWNDVLKNGPASRYARHFDIDWGHKILLPFLGDDSAEAVKMVREKDEFMVAYHDRRFPLSPATQEKLARDPAAWPGVLEEQHYRLAHWRKAGTEINYRRFFEVSDLVSLRQEDAAVFPATHDLIFSWLREGRVTGLRVDHPDGLFNPQEYFKRLQKGAGSAVYVVAEKILGADETLPADWLVNGTTGYDFLNRVNGLFVDSSQAATLDSAYRDFTGTRKSFDEVARAGKRKVLEESFGSELNSLIAQLQSMENTISAGDFRAAVIEFIVAFPVYRTYFRRGARLSAADVAVIDAAAARVSIHSGAVDFIRAVLLSPKEHPGGIEFMTRFQQLTGPAAAKGIEDTSFYRYHRLVSLNEVGGDPGKFGTSVEEFHRSNADQKTRWPDSLLATSTHDTKRGEDVRARINVLSEFADEWTESVTRWAQLPALGKTSIARNDAYLLYQTMIGAWPEARDDWEEFEKRLEEYMVKALREGKEQSSWLHPQPDYEAAVGRLIHSLLAAGSPLRDELDRWRQRTTFFGRLNSLAQVLLKITSPGVPDFYQGTELWDLSLVDPDNRRKVDYTLRERLLRKLKDGWQKGRRRKLIEDLKTRSETGEIKLFVIWRALAVRQQQRELFQRGDYIPLTVTGTQSNHVCAFARRHGDQWAVIIAPRLMAGLTAGRPDWPVGDFIWDDTAVELPGSFPAHLENSFTGQMVNVGAEKKLSVATALGYFPVGLLLGAG